MSIHFSTKQGDFYRYEELIDIQQSTTVEQFENMLANMTRATATFRLTDGITGAGATVLTRATEMNNVILTTHILSSPEGKALIDLGDMYGQTALHRAAHRANAKALKILMAHGANLNSETDSSYMVAEGEIAKGTTPLWIAAMKEVDPKTLKLMVANGAICKGAIKVPDCLGGQLMADTIAKRIVDKISTL